MLQLSFLELVARAIPESFLFVLSVYVFSRKELKIKNYIISSLLLAITVFLIRMLPISYGMHTILNIVLLVIITAGFDNINILDSVRSGILTAIMMFICEGINMFMIQCCYGDNVSSIFRNPIRKTIYGIPSLVIFMVFILLIRFIINKRSDIKDV